MVVGPFGTIVVVLPLICTVVVVLPRGRLAERVQGPAATTPLLRGQTELAAVEDAVRLKLSFTSNVVPTGIAASVRGDEHFIDRQPFVQSQIAVTGEPVQAIAALHARRAFVSRTCTNRDGRCSAGSGCRQLEVAVRIDVNAAVHDARIAHQLARLAVRSGR